MKSDSRRDAMHLSLALRPFVIPFLLGGILLAFWACSGVLGITPADLGKTLTLPQIATLLVLVPIGIYLGALVGYVVLLAVFRLVLSKAHFEAMNAALPSEQSTPPLWLLAPFAAMRRFVVG